MLNVYILKWIWYDVISSLKLISGNFVLPGEQEKILDSDSKSLKGWEHEDSGDTALHIIASS